MSKLSKKAIILKTVGNKLVTTTFPCFFDKIKIKHGPLKLGKMQLTTKSKHGQLN